MRGKGWSRRFDDPIALPDGTELATLREAIAYLVRHPVYLGLRTDMRAEDVTRACEKPRR